MDIVAEFFANEEVIAEISEGRGRKFRRNAFFKKERKQTYAGLRRCRYEYDELADEFLPVYYKRYSKNLKGGKHLANKRVRKARMAASNDLGWYRKVSESWDICDC